jgi:hypothetical protein
MRPDGLLELFLCHPERSEGTRILPRPLFLRERMPTAPRSVGEGSASEVRPSSFCVILERSEESGSMYLTQF